MLRNGVFDDEQFLNFQHLNKRKTVYGTSVVSQYLMRSEEAVHDYGEGVAKAGNARIRSQNDGEIPEDRQQFYLGFYKLKYGDVVRVQMDFYKLHVHWRPENDCDEHFQIEMWQLSSAGSRGERRRDRQAAVNRIARKLHGPWKPVVPPHSPRQFLLSTLPSKS